MSTGFRTTARWTVAASVALAMGISAPWATADTKKGEKKDAAAATTAASKAAADKAKAEADAMMAAMQKYANPGPMHDALKPLAGNWKTSTKTWLGPGEPTVSEGSCERTWVLGGRFLESKYRGVFAGNPFEGIELLGYDTRKKQFTSAWIDNMGTSVALSTGPAEDPASKTITLNSSFDDPISGQPMPYKMVTKIIDDNSHTFSMISSKDGQEWTEMEITYTRAK